VCVGMGQEGGGGGCWSVCGWGVACDGWGVCVWAAWTDGRTDGQQNGGKWDPSVSTRHRSKIAAAPRAQSKQGLLPLLLLLLLHDCVSVLVCVPPTSYRSCVSWDGRRVCVCLFVGARD
jgi:hypothetical protein